MQETVRTEILPGELLGANSSFLRRRSSSLGEVDSQAGRVDALLTSEFQEAGQHPFVFFVHLNPRYHQVFTFGISSFGGKISCCSKVRY